MKPYQRIRSRNTTVVRTNPITGIKVYPAEPKQRGPANWLTVVASILLVVIVAGAALWPMV